MFEDFDISIRPITISDRIATHRERMKNRDAIPATDDQPCIEIKYKDKNSEVEEVKKGT